MQELEGNEVKVRHLEEFIDVCDKLRLLIEYSIDEESGNVRFLTKYQGRTLIYETDADELYKAVNKIRELKESVVWLHTFSQFSLQPFPICTPWKFFSQWSPFCAGFLALAFLGIPQLAH